MCLKTPNQRSIAMLVLRRTVLRGCACVFALGLLSLLPTRAEAQVNPFNPLTPFNPFFPPPIIPLPVPVNPNSINGGGGGVTRATSSLANPINFYQWGQVTGVGPIRGTVRIYNQFGLVEQNQQNQGGLGGLGGLYGGLLGGNNNNNQLPGQGATQGDDPPQGVLLHVNYANMFLPNQQQINGGGNAGLRGGFGGFGGGFGGFGGGGFGKGYFGNGANGL
jgi:hypothetical protein